MVDRGMAAEPGNKDLAKQLGEALGKGIADAIQQQQKVTELAQQATTANAKSQFAPALSLAEQALRLDPRHEGALVEKGKALRGLGQVTEAIAHFEQAVAKFPKSAPLHNFLGGTYGRAGEPAKAIAEQKIAARLDPKNPIYVTNQVSHYLALGDLPGAEAACRAALAIDSKNPTAHNSLGAVYLKMDRLDEGIAAFQESLRLKPGDQTAQAAIDAARNLQRVRAEVGPATARDGALPATAKKAELAPPVVAAAPTPVRPPTASSGPEIPSPLPSRGRVTLKVGTGEHEASRDIAVTFAADSVVPTLWFGLVAKGQPAESGAWSERVINDQKAGSVVLRAPAVPGDYEVRVYAGEPAEAPEVARAALVRVVAPRAAGDELPMAEVDEPAAEPVVALSPPPEPVVSVKSVARGETEALAAAIAEFHTEWLGANPAQPRRSLQLEVEQPATAFNLALTYTGKDRQSPLEVGLPLKLSAERVKAIVRDRPVTIASAKTAEKGPTQYRLRYPSAEVPKASAVLAELLAESNAFGHPATRGGKKQPVEAKAEPGKAAPAKAVVVAAKQVGPLPWETSRWNKQWPLPVKRPALPPGVRQYHAEVYYEQLETYNSYKKYHQEYIKEIRAKPKSEQLVQLAKAGIDPSRLDSWDEFEEKLVKPTPGLSLRFDWSERDGIQINWVAAPTFDFPRDPYTPWTSDEFSRSLPMINGRGQAAETRPTVDLPSFDNGWRVEINRSALTGYGDGKYRVLFRKWVKAEGRGNDFKLTFEGDFRYVEVNDDYRPGEGTWRSYGGPSSDPDRESHEAPPVLTQAGPVSTTGSFDPRSGKLSGLAAPTKPDPRPTPMHIGFRVYEYGTEFGGSLDDNQPPVWIAEARAPVGFIRAEKELTLPLKIAAAEKPPAKALVQGRLPYKLAVTDLETGAEIAKPQTGELKPGETAEPGFKIKPPAMNGVWRVRATLTCGEFTTTKDLEIPVGGFPVQFVRGQVTPQTVVAGQSVGVGVELLNVMPRGQSEAPDARGTGSWGLYDTATGTYLAIGRGSSQPTFDLMPGAGTSAVVKAVAPASATAGFWRLALVMWDLEGRTVATRDLPPVFVSAPLGELAEREAGALPADCQAPSPEQMWLAHTQQQYQSLQGNLTQIKAEIARIEESMSKTPAAFTDIVGRYRARLEKYQQRRDEVFGELDETMARSQSFFARRLGETPKGSQAAQALEQAHQQLARGAKMVRLDALASHRDTRALAKLAQEAGTSDPILAAEANKQLGVLAYSGAGEGGRRQALQAFRNAAEKNPDDPAAAGLARQIEKDYLKDIHVRLQGEMSEVQRKFETELGNRGEAGLWGSLYDTVTIGVGTSTQSLVAKASGKQPDIEVMAEVVGAIEKEAGAQQAGLVFMRKLVDAGLTMEQVAGLDLKQLYAARALAARGLRPGVATAELGALSVAERRALADVNPEQLKRVFPALKKFLDSGVPVPERTLAVGLGSVRAALNNPDVKSLTNRGDRNQLVVDHQESTIAGSYLGGETLEMSGTQMVVRGGLDIVNVLSAVSFIPGAQTAGGGTVARQFIGGLAKVSPRTAQFITAAHEARQEMTVMQQIMLDTTLSLGAGLGATAVTGDERVGIFAAGLVDAFTGGLDAEGIARKFLAAGVEAGAVRTVKTRARKALEAAAVPDFQLGPLLRRVDEQLAPGCAAEALTALRARAGALKQALQAELPDSLRAVRNNEAQLLGKLIKQAEQATPEGLAEARKTLQFLQSVNVANQGLVAQLTRKAEVLEQLEKRLLRGRTLTAKAEELKGEFMEKIGRRILPDGEFPLGDAEVNALLKDPEKVRQYIDAGLLPGMHEQQIAARNAQRLFQAREDAMNDLFLDHPEYAQLFHHFRDTGSWPKGKTFRDADMTAKLEVEPPEKVLRELYEKRGLGGAGTRPYRELLEIYQADDALKRDVLFKFRETLGFHVGRLHGHPGSPQQVLKEYDIVLNEIPGPPHLLGGRRMSSEEYRLKQGFSRAEALLGPDSKVCTRVMFDNRGGMKLRSGFRVDEVRLPGDVPMKLEPKHSLAKVYDEWMMFWDHSAHATSEWDRVQKVGKYPGRVNDELAFLLHAPDSLVPPKAKQAMAKMQENFSDLFAEWKAIKRQSGDIGYAAATEKVLKGRIDRFRAKFPAATEAELKEMAGGEYLKECQSYFRAMTSVTKLVPGARTTMQSTDAVGASFHEYLRQNSELRQVLVFNP